MCNDCFVWYTERVFNGDETLPSPWPCIKISTWHGCDMSRVSQSRVTMNTWERGSCNSSPKKNSCLQNSLRQIWNFKSRQVIDGSVVWQYLTALHWSLTQFTPAGSELRRILNGGIPKNQRNIRFRGENVDLPRWKGWMVLLIRWKIWTTLDFSSSCAMIQSQGLGKKQRLGERKKDTQEAQKTEVWMYLHEMSRSASCRWSFLALLLSSSHRC